MPDRAAEHSVESADTNSIRELHEAAVDIALGHLALPNVHPVLVRVGVMITVNKPEFVGNGCEFNVQGPLRLHVAKKNDCGRLKFSGSFDDLAKRAVRVAAE